MFILHQLGRVPLSRLRWRLRSVRVRRVCQGWFQEIRALLQWVQVHLQQVHWKVTTVILSFEGKSRFFYCFVLRSYIYEFVFLIYYYIYIYLMNSCYFTVVNPHLTSASGTSAVEPLCESSSRRAAASSDSCLAISANSAAWNYEYISD